MEHPCSQDPGDVVVNTVVCGFLRRKQPGNTYGIMSSLYVLIKCLLLLNNGNTYKLDILYAKKFVNLPLSEMVSPDLDLFLTCSKLFKSSNS